MFRRFTLRLKAAALFGFAALSGVAMLGFASAAPAALIWSTAYDQTNATTNQLRAVEVADQAGNDSVYVGFIQTSGNRDVRRYDSNSPYGLLNTRPAAGGDQPKAIATDDRGNVFVGNRISGGSSAKITVHSATLGAGTDITTDVPSNQFGGLAVTKIGADYFLYASRETGAEIRRYNVNNPAAPVLDTTFGTLGVFTVPGSGSGILRGLAVQDDGTIFVTSRDDSRVYRVSPDLSTTTFAAITRAMDVALFDGNAYVTSYNGASSNIGVFAMSNLAAQGTILVTTLDGNPYARGAAEGFSAIDIDSTGRIFMGDQAYQLSGTTSDRLLVSTPIPEPAAAGLLLAGFAALAARRRRG